MHVHDHVYTVDTTSPAFWNDPGMFFLGLALWTLWRHQDHLPHMRQGMRALLEL